MLIRPKRGRSDVGYAQIGLSEEEEDVARAYLTENMRSAETEGLNEGEEDEAKGLWVDGVWIDGVVATSEETTELRGLLSDATWITWGMVVGPTIAHIVRDIEADLFTSNFAGIDMVNAIREEQDALERRNMGGTPERLAGTTEDLLEGEFGDQAWRDERDAPSDSDYDEEDFATDERTWFTFREVPELMEDWRDDLLAAMTRTVRAIPIESILEGRFSSRPFEKAAVSTRTAEIIARKWLPVMVKQRELAINQMYEKVMLDFGAMLRVATGAQTTVAGAKDAIVFGTVFEATQIGAQIDRQTELMNGALAGLLSWGRLREEATGGTDLGDLPPEMMDIILRKATETDPLEVLAMELVSDFTPIVVSQIRLQGIISGWLARLEAVRAAILAEPRRLARAPRGAGIARYQRVIDSIREVLKKMTETHAKSRIPRLKETLLVRASKMTDWWIAKRHSRLGAYTDEELWYAVRSVVFDSEQTLLAGRGLVLRAVNEIRLIAEEHRNVFGGKPPRRRRKLLGARMGEGRPSSTTACDVFRLL